MSPLSIQKHPHFALWAVLCLGSGCTRLLDVEGLEDEACPKGTKACYDGAGAGYCEETTFPEYGCGLPGCYPCVVPNALATCGDDGRCTFSQCIAGHDDCDGEDFNGCEVNLGYDLDNCGKCETPVESRHASVACSAMTHVVESCSPGYGNCNDDAKDGCETRLGTDTDCSDCRDSCGPESHCEEGQCTAATE